MGWGGLLCVNIIHLHGLVSCGGVAGGGCSVLCGLSVCFILVCLSIIRCVWGLYLKGWGGIVYVCESMYFCM